MKKILLIATGGTIASKYTKDGLSPQISAEELLSYIPAASAFCTIDTLQPFSLDSTNISPQHWIQLAALIEKKYEFYDGFVICHGTDLIQNFPDCNGVTAADIVGLARLSFLDKKRVGADHVADVGEVAHGT